MQKLSTVVFLVLGSATLLQAQLQSHNRSRASASLSSISFSAASVVGGDFLIGTVHLTAPAPSEGAVVTLILDDPGDSCVIPVSVQVSTGATSANFAVQTRAVSSNFTVTVLGTYGVTRRASLVVTDASTPVSYTHLDVYKRQSIRFTPRYSTPERFSYYRAPATARRSRPVVHKGHNIPRAQRFSTCPMTASAPCS